MELFTDSIAPILYVFRGLPDYMAVIKVCAYFQKDTQTYVWRPLQSVFAGRLQRNGCFRAASGNFVIQCRRHYKVFLQEASNETRLCKGSPVWPFIILKGSDSLYNFRLWAQRPSTLYRAPTSKRDPMTKTHKNTHREKYAQLSSHLSRILSDVPRHWAAVSDQLN